MTHTKDDEKAIDRTARTSSMINKMNGLELNRIGFKQELVKILTDLNCRIDRIELATEQVPKIDQE